MILGAFPNSPVRKELYKPFYRRRDGMGLREVVSLAQGCTAGKW